MLPPGTQVYQAERSQSGHLVIPCCQFLGQKEKSGSLTLLTQETDSKQDDGDAGVASVREVPTSLKEVYVFAKMPFEGL